MESRGGVTGGVTLNDYLAGFAREGYTGTFAVRREGTLHCETCGETLDPHDVALMSLRRVEGVSDPADMGAVAAMVCPKCDARGTATFCFGPSCPPEDGHILRALDNHRPTSRIVRDAEADPALVRDTGWLSGPREG